MTYAEIEGTCCWNLCHRNGTHCEYIELGYSREINVFAYKITAGDCVNFYDDYDDYHYDEDYYISQENNTNIDY